MPPIEPVFKAVDESFSNEDLAHVNVPSRSQIIEACQRKEEGHLQTTSAAKETSLKSPTDKLNSEDVGGSGLSTLAHHRYFNQILSKAGSFMCVTTNASTKHIAGVPNNGCGGQPSAPPSRTPPRISEQSTPYTTQPVISTNGAERGRHVWDIKTSNSQASDISFMDHEYPPIACPSSSSMPQKQYLKEWYRYCCQCGFDVAMTAQDTAYVEFHRTHCDECRWESYYTFLEL
ncbi:uncharacterized protein BP5553_08634 [Venustampulla echinocandica]|uniref:Uncharacterized protein n=1 Tax=Venustampulla echinocandica TaxID=2656787 RepID=A0A370TES5_9HELO|nr:uncharacterized protein BP5553_08634 [Venustampulla echinocandica]RDL33195.1 hypothetical protein BP5553_08634 [Venustampulla echinocandica]